FLWVCRSVWMCSFCITRSLLARRVPAQPARIAGAIAVTLPHRHSPGSARKRQPSRGLAALKMPGVRAWSRRLPRRHRARAGGGGRVSRGRGSRPNARLRTLAPQSRWATGGGGVVAAGRAPTGRPYGWRADGGISPSRVGGEGGPLIHGEAADGGLDGA